MHATERGQQVKAPEEDTSLFCWRHSEEPPVTGGTGFKKGKQDLRPKQGGAGRARSTHRP